MEVIVNLKNHVGQGKYTGSSVKILGKELYEYFFTSLKGYHIEKIFLIATEENDILSNKIIKKFKDSFNFEPIVSSKLSDASLIKRLVNNKKIKDHFLYFTHLSFHDINLQDFLDYHKYQDSYFTPCLMKRPRSYTNNGYIYINNDKKIQSFNYKCLDDTELFPYINTGIYAVSKKAINEIQNNNNGIKLVEDLLKHIVFKNKKSLAYISENYYNLLCTTEEYYNLHLDLLKGIVSSSLIKVDYKNSTYIPEKMFFGKDFFHQSPFMVSDNAKIGNHVKVINTIISGNAKISDNVTIENSFIGEDVIIEANSVIKNAYLFNQFISSNTYHDGNESEKL